MTTDMKEIRKIKNVVDEEEVEDQNNNEDTITLDKFDSEPGYYQQVIRPMLAPGHETELLYWLRSIGLIPQTQTCKNAINNECCNKPMTWTRAKTKDAYQWKCLNCSEKRTVRDNSVFFEVRCNFKNAMRILLGWCKGKDIETMANILGLKKHVVHVLYTIAAKTADKYIKSHLPDWRIGGPGVIVIIDTYPEGCTNNRPNRSYRPILCCAEVKDIPPKYWFEALQRYSKNKIEQVTVVKQHILQVIQDVVMAGSILLVNLNSSLCSYEDLKSLKYLYPTIVTVNDLKRHDNINQNVMNNLETIWKSALDVCEEAQYYQANQVQSFLISQMWKQKYDRESFEMILNQLVEY